MTKKIISLCLCVGILLLSGCSKSRHIDTAALAENVTVDVVNGETVYSFYLLSSEKSPWKIDIPATSFKSACKLAQEKYIPNLSLAKIDMMLINEKIYKSNLKQDIGFVSSQSEFSPVAYVALADSATLERMQTDKKVPHIIENELEQLKNNTDSISTNFLSVYNSMTNDKDGFFIPCINSNNELRVEIMKIQA